MCWIWRTLACLALVHSNRNLAEETPSCSKGTIEPVCEDGLYVYRDFIKFDDCSDLYVSMELIANNNDHFIKIKVTIPSMQNREPLEILQFVNEENQASQGYALSFDFDTRRYAIRSRISLVGYRVSYEPAEEEEEDFYTSSPEIEGTNMIASVLAEAEHLLSNL
jgi:hypothetical protein